MNTWPEKDRFLNIPYKGHLILETEENTPSYKNNESKIRQSLSAFELIHNSISSMNVSTGQ